MCRPAATCRMVFVSPDYRVWPCRTPLLKDAGLLAGLVAPHSMAVARVSSSIRTFAGADLLDGPCRRGRGSGIAVFFNLNSR